MGLQPLRASAAILGHCRDKDHPIGSQGSPRKTTCQIEQWDVIPSSAQANESR